MNKSDILLPLLASIGVGAATFYTMSKTNQPLDKAMETVSPIITDLTSSNVQKKQTN